MITARATRLIRAPDVRAMQRAILAAVPGGWGARDCAVLVPTATAAEALRRTWEEHVLSSGTVAGVLPDILTRAELYIRLHERLPGAPPLVSDFERDLLLRLAIGDAQAAGIEPPFRVRPGLLAPMLAFYDDMRRRGRTIDSFDRLVRAQLEPGRDVDRGAARLLEQTQFLAAALASFEGRVADSGGIDEHALRALLVSASGPPAYRQLIVTVADQAADPRGLWPADFDLLARLPGIERLDVVATERVLASGWHERLHEALPGIEEERVEASHGAPALLVPPHTPSGDVTAHFTARDREEELVEAVRWSKRRARSAAASPLSRMAVVFGRPLPYLYLARQTFESGGVPYQAFDALPLAAEPYAAALDLVFTAVLEDASRTSVIELLSSPHWNFGDAVRGGRLRRRDIAALDRLLIESKYLGGWDALRRLAEGEAGSPDARRAARAAAAAPAMAAALAVGDCLQAWPRAASASAQIAAMLEFVTGHERLPAAHASSIERHLRARGAILGALTALADAHGRHDDRPLPIGDLIATIRRWIERQTFAPRTGAAGVLLLDAPAAPYASVDAVRLVGLIDTEWPEPRRQDVFYPGGLLRDLGWTPEAQRLAAARAQFEDLLLLAREEVSVSSFTLEADALVLPSPFLEEVRASGLPVVHEAAGAPPRMLAHEALLLDPPARAPLTPAAAEWLETRRAGAPEDDARYRGQIGRREAEPYAASRVERYLECPFKYFAAHVLRLEEEREDESGLTPQERGQLLHGVFEAFFRAWAQEGRGTITTANLGEAVDLFAGVAEQALAALPPADRHLERTYLLGSAASAGLAERAFALEIEHGAPVAERLLEHVFDGTYTLEGDAGPRQVHIRGKADRIDVLADGALRVLDYKLGRAPKPARTVQLAVYGACAAQDLGAASGRPRPVRYAGFIAFRERNAFVELGGRSGDVTEALREGQQRFLRAVDGIEAGEFPVDPEDPWLCTRCGFAHVCRKDYVGDE